MIGPQAPAVVFLDRRRELEARRYQGSQFREEPRYKVLTEAAGIDEVRLHFPVLEQVSFNRDLVVHIPYAHRPPITRRSPPVPLRAPYKLRPRFPFRRVAARVDQRTHPRRAVRL